MELCKNIFFNTDKLTPNSEIKISYTGRFFQDGSEDVKSDLGFQAELTLEDNENLSFCFKNGNNEWDNNDGKNYVFPIEHIETDLILVDDSLSLSSPRKLRKSYIISKKIKLAIYKVLRYLPKLVSGTYTSSKNNVEN